MDNKLQAEKEKAIDFLSEQVQKLDDAQKEKLAYVLLGATLAQPLVGAATGQESQTVKG